MTGHRVTDDWMGEPVETLADLLRPGLRAVCVGINPSLVSVRQGHYYRGRLGQRFFARLRVAGVLPHRISGFEDDALFALDVGFTDIVKRPTARAVELRQDEYEHGRELLIAKLHRHRPHLVLFTYKKSAEVLMGRFRGVGLLPGCLDGIDAFVMPGPYAPASQVAPLLVELQACVGASSRR